MGINIAWEIAADCHPSACIQVEKGTSSTVTNEHSVGIKYGLSTTSTASRYWFIPTWSFTQPDSILAFYSLPDFEFVQASVTVSEELRSVLKTRDGRED